MSIVRAASRCVNVPAVVWPPAVHCGIVFFFRMSIVLVTGGSGFIGSHLLDRLVADAEVELVLNVDIKKGTVHEKIRSFTLDIANPRIVTETLSPHIPYITHIVHLAAKPGVQDSISLASECARVNILGSIEIFEFSRNCPKLVSLLFASSSSVYGERPAGAFVETDVCTNPASPYASSKCAVELLGRNFSDLFGIPIVGLRFFTVYGPSGRADMLVRRLVDAAVQGRVEEQTRQLTVQSTPTLSIFGNASREFTFVTDAVEAIVLAMKASLSNKFELINVGGGEVCSVSRLIEIVEAEVGKISIAHHPAQPGDVSHTQADLSKARTLLGFEPRVGLAEGIRRCVVEKPDLTLHSRGF